MTKEKFLRAIVGDPPLVVGHNENVELEAQLVQVKSELRARKEEVRILTEEMEAMGRDLAKRKLLLCLKLSCDRCTFCGFESFLFLAANLFPLGFSRV